MMVGFDVADVAILQQCMKTEGLVHFSLLQWNLLKEALLAVNFTITHFMHLEGLSFLILIDHKSLTFVILLFYTTIRNNSLSFVLIVVLENNFFCSHSIYSRKFNFFKIMLQLESVKVFKWYIECVKKTQTIVMEEINTSIKKLAP